MESKKTKLTISGTAKKSIKNIEIAKTQGKNSVVIEKPKSNFVKKGSSFKSFSTNTKSKPHKKCNTTSAQTKYTTKTQKKNTWRNI